tara:strand:+ start:56 stop:712 length:657 start_codon:yes stop_codon:yes gene_type:complete
MTYTELVAAIQDYTEYTFSVAQVNTFITQTEKRVHNAVQFPSLRKSVLGVLTTGIPYLSCPDDFLSSFSLSTISAEEYSFLENKDVNYIRQVYPNPTTDVGKPKCYALFGPQSLNQKELTFILGPTPDANYAVEMHYYFYPESITVSSDGRSWLGDNMDMPLLYGSLVEAYTFMKGEADLIGLYNTKYGESLSLAKRLGDGLERQDAYRSGQARVQVT